MGRNLQFLVLLGLYLSWSTAHTVLPSFQQLKANYPGYRHHGGYIRNNHLIKMIGCQSEKLLHDSSALRLSYALNKIGEPHSLGTSLIRLSKFGEDSVVGRNGLQYIYHPIAYGPFLADKYGYPSISKLHQKDPIHTKKNFWGKQGILRVITYTQHSNLPVGHVALWDCNKFFQSKDWIAMHSLITVEFWESPDSNCSGNATSDLKPTFHTSPQTEHPRNNHHQHLSHHSMKTGESKHLQTSSQPQPAVPSQTKAGKTNFNQKHTISTSQQTNLLHNPSYRRKFLKKYFLSNGHLRHARHRGLVLRKNNPQG